jgi:hypothetical protein
MYKQDGDENRLFSPQTQAQMRAKIETLLQQMPTEELGMEQSRWRLHDLMRYVPELKSRSGMWRVLRKLGFGYRRS